MVELALVMTVGDDRREFKLLPGGPPLVVGRGADASYRIEAPLLSRRHFEIRFDDDHAFEWSDQVLCAACQEGSSSEIRTDALSDIANKLKEEGFQVIERISSEGTLVPVFKAKRTGGLEDVVAIKALPLVKGLS